MQKAAKTVLLASGFCFLAAAELLAQGGLGAPPGQMGGGARGGAGSRATAPSGRIPEAAPSDGREGAAVGLRPANRPERAPSRPVGNILSPGTPEGRLPRSAGSQSFPGILGQPNILSPGKPGPYRPGNVVTPGTPSAPPAPGGLFADPNPDRDPSGRFRGNRGFGRGRGGVVVYPYVYFGYSYGGYGDTGAVSRTSPNASYVIEGHLDQTGLEGRSRVYEVGSGGENPYEESELLDGEQPSEGVEPGLDEEMFDLIALKGGLVYVVRDHWLLGNTVHFVTMRDDHYVVSLQEVDLDLSAKLNRERGRKFVLEVRERDSSGSPGADVAR